MRPRKLVAHAFGPFAGTAEVDFDALAGAGLFLIHGPTGAGKTSILDAICFALFGVVPGDRTVDGVRSHHSEPSVESSVELEFSVRDDDWRVTRHPAQERARQRGDGTTTVQAKATLARRDGAGWQAVAQGVREVGAEISRLVGLDAEQFQQVVLLPQGEFERALRADARERERLLSTLFATERFSRYAANLGERAKAARDALDAHDRAMEAITTRAVEAWRDGLGDASRPTPESPDVSALAQDVEQAAGAAEGRARGVETEAATARQAFVRAEQVAERLEKRDRLKHRLDALSGRATEIESKERCLADARRAAPLLTILDAIADQRERCTTSARDLSDCRKDAERAVCGLPDAAAETRAKVLAWPSDDHLDHHLVGPVLDDLAALAQEVAALAGRAAQAATAREKEKGLRSEAAGLAQVAAAHKKKGEELSESLEKVDQQISAAREAAARLAGLETAAANLDAIAAAAESLVPLEAAHETARRALSDALSNTINAKEAYEALLARRIDNMAGELASRLQAGSPCPVCGSTEHPAPASDAGAVSTKELNDAKRAARDAEKAAKEADGTSRKIENQIVELRTRAGDAAKNPQQAREAADAAAHEAEVTRSLSQSLGELESGGKGLQDSTLGAQEAQQKALDESAKTTSEADAEARLASDHEAAVRAVLGEVSPADIGPAIDSAREKLAAVQRLALDAASARDALDQLRKDLPEQLRDQGFETEDAALAAALPPTEQDEIDQELHSHRAELATVTSGLADPELANLPDAPDLDSLREKVEAAEKSLRLAQERATIARENHKKLTALCADHSTACAARKPLEQRAAMVGNLAGICRGVEGSRISLERFVLGAYMEEIVSAASLRLRDMSGGRYTLLFSNERVKGGGASGLSIRVQDAWTGRPREVTSLSGGETFLASLALALAVADVVRSNRGGVDLGALFVDEGFGSLDPDALDQSLGVLDTLRAGGRMVGVISHVPAVKERIVHGIEVTPTPTGSVIRVTASGD